MENPVFYRFLKIIVTQIQLPITFCSEFVCNKTLKARNSHTYKFLTFNIPIAKSNTKIVFC